MNEPFKIYLLFIVGWLHEGFGSYNEAFYVSGAVAIFSAVLLFGVDYMGRRHRKTVTYVPRHREPICECTEIIESSPFSCAEDSVSELGHKDVELQPMLDGECAKRRCQFHDALEIRDLLRIVDRETVL